MTPTGAFYKEEMTRNGGVKGHATAHDVAHNDGLLRELQALRRSEAVLRDFIETSTISLHWVGADGTILWANQAEARSSRVYKKRVFRAKHYRIPRR
jgi:hypothetical protein